MDVLKQRCKTCNNIHPVRTTCPACVEQARAKVVAKAGPPDGKDGFDGQRLTYVTPWMRVVADPSMPPGQFTLVDASAFNMPRMDLQPELTGAAKLEADCCAIDEWVNEGYVAYADGQRMKREKLGLPPAEPERDTIETMRSALDSHLANLGLPKTTSAYYDRSRDRYEFAVRNHSVYIFDGEKCRSAGADRHAVYALVKGITGPLRDEAAPYSEAQPALEKWCRGMGIPVR
jgi:hypothetical protein